MALWSLRLCNAFLPFANVIQIDKKYKKVRSCEDEEVKPLFGNPSRQGGLRRSAERLLEKARPETSRIPYAVCNWSREQEGEEPMPSPDEDFPITDYRSVRLNQIAPAVADCLVYIYDFGDSWEHDIVVEEILPAEKATRKPRRNLARLLLRHGEGATSRQEVPRKCTAGLWIQRDDELSLRQQRIHQPRPVRKHPAGAKYVGPVKQDQ